MTTVLVPPARVLRWFDNFERRHGVVSYTVGGGALLATAEDGSTAAARLPFDADYAGPPLPAALAASVALPACWGVLLVRKGGFAVARLHGAEMAAHKTGQRHVQGRTKAGGQSQQRFARRRDNQARTAYAAAADHAARLLAGHRLDALLTGGDRSAVEAVLDDPRLAAAAAVRSTRWLSVGDPRREVLDAAVAAAGALYLEVADTANGDR